MACVASARCDKSFREWKYAPPKPSALSAGTSSVACGRSNRSIITRKVTQEDGLDAATLIYGYMRDPSHLVGVIVSFVLVTPIVILDIVCALKMSGESKTPLAPTHDYSGRSGMGGTA